MTGQKVISARYGTKLSLSLDAVTHSSAATVPPQARKPAFGLRRSHLRILFLHQQFALSRLSPLFTSFTLLYLPLSTSPPFLISSRSPGISPTTLITKMAAISTVVARDTYAALSKRQNWAAQEPGVITVFCIVGVVAIGLICLFIYKKLVARRERRQAVV
ncbi:LOW QUALITY PROTEIN: hypothetical protein QC761_201705 [Podospora bellae-mahoneyi]|uniref:Uncharacterized protein n=1 Tax=Podospora bellae-mahoneyi TaxID=2093777 RepID=A0ABR0FR70_9PEZI|nr:LOW QUALITY PROTEIN: hypothetical protein QC761_201705 [Podospora bellae-mahoneyi]